MLEEELLFPANTQLALFVSMDVGRLFSLGSVQILLRSQDGLPATFTPRWRCRRCTVAACKRLYLGNLRGGEHELVAYFTGEGPHQRDYKRGTKLSFAKGSEPKYIELQIKDAQARLQPEFEVKVWQ